MFGFGRKLRSVLPALIVCVLVGLVVPAVGANAAGSNKAKIDEMKATDAELTKGIASLDKDIAKQQAEVDAANQAMDAANRTITIAEARIADLQQRLGVLRELAAQRAVNEYMQPNEGVLLQILSAQGFDEASRRTEIIREMSDSNFNAVDEMRAVNRDLERERKVASSARDATAERRDGAQRMLNDLKKTREEKSRLEQELKARIAAAAEEDSVVRRPDSSTANMTLSASGLIWPTVSHTVTSPYGMRWGRMHEGIDIAASVGTPIYAVKAGTVTWAGTESGYGNYICVTHDDGFQSCNGHASRISVRKGQKVEQGAQLGTTGNTGASRGPHLHFETCASKGPSCVYGTTRNPMNFLPK